MIASAKLTSKFQMTIPATFRRLMGIEAGDVVILTGRHFTVGYRDMRRLRRPHG